jgi:hypothetical protein
MLAYDMLVYDAQLHIIHYVLTLNVCSISVMSEEQFLLKYGLLTVKLVIIIECESLYKDLEVVFTCSKNTYRQKTVELQAEAKHPKDYPERDILSERLKMKVLTRKGEENVLWIFFGGSRRY